MTDYSTTTLWDFSLALYNEKPVQNACLALQDRHDIDVNILLFCCWLGIRNTAIDRNEMQTVLTHTQVWQRMVVKPLRAIRHDMKGGVGLFPVNEAETLRAKIKSLELESEYLEQQQLETHADRLTERKSQASDRSDLMLANLQLYFVISKFIPKSEDTVDLETLVTESMRLTYPNNKNSVN